MCNTYHLICREGNEWTAFNTTTEQYKYLIMPVELFNAPAILQTQMNYVLCDIFNWHVSIYLDDILIFSHYREQHIHHAWSVFQHLLMNSLYIKAEKCGWGLSDPCAFFSCCLFTAERISDIAKRELFTVKMALEWHHWLEVTNKAFCVDWSQERAQTMVSSLPSEFSSLLGASVCSSSGFNLWTMDRLSVWIKKWWHACSALPLRTPLHSPQLLFIEYAHNSIFPATSLSSFHCAYDCRPLLLPAQEKSFSCPGRHPLLLQDMAPCSTLKRSTPCRSVGCHAVTITTAHQ